MNYLDIILAIPLLWAIYKGFTKGLIFTVASLVALILGVYGSIHFSIFFEEYVIRWFNPSEKYLSVISFSICFIIIVIGVHLIAFLIDRMVKAVALGMINRIAGVVFNVVKVAFILSIILSVINTFNNYGGLIPKEDRTESVLYEPVSSFAPAVFPHLKFEHIQQRFRK